MKRKILIIVGICIVPIMIMLVIILTNKSKNDIPISHNEYENKIRYDESYRIIKKF